jgi:hypothetical protein
MNKDPVSRSQLEHRMAMRPALLLSIQNWLAKHGHETGSPDIRACLKQWTKAQERDGFALSVPSRWKYFKHFVEFSQIYGEIMTGRHRSYLRAFAALFLGYDHLHLLDDVRMKTKRLENSTAGKSSAGEKALTAKG